MESGLKTAPDITVHLLCHAWGPGLRLRPTIWDHHRRNLRGRSASSLPHAQNKKGEENPRAMDHEHSGSGRHKIKSESESAWTQWFQLDDRFKVCPCCGKHHFAPFYAHLFLPPGLALGLVPAWRFYHPSSGFSASPSLKQRAQIRGRRYHCSAHCSWTFPPWARKPESSQQSWAVYIVQPHPAPGCFYCKMTHHRTSYSSTD